MKEKPPDTSLLKFSVPTVNGPPVRKTPYAMLLAALNVAVALGLLGTVAGVQSDAAPQSPTVVDQVWLNAAPTRTKCMIIAPVAAARKAWLVF